MMLAYIAGLLLIPIALFVGQSYRRFRREMRAAKARLQAGSQQIQTQSGPVEYAEVGTGYPVLISHGGAGGYDIAAACTALSEAVEMNRAAGNLFDAYQALEQLGDVLNVQGKLRQTAAMVHQSLQQATNDDGRLQPVAGFALLGLGRVYYERYEYDDATQCFHQALEMARRYGQEYIVLNACIAVALVKQSQRDWAGAQSMLDEAAQVAQKWDRIRPWERVALVQAKVWLAQGNLAAASRWLEECGLVVGEPSNDWHEMSYLLCITNKRSPLTNEPVLLTVPLLSPRDRVPYPALVRR